MAYEEEEEDSLVAVYTGGFAEHGCYGLLLCCQCVERSKAPATSGPPQSASKARQRSVQQPSALCQGPQSGCHFLKTKESLALIWTSGLLDDGWLQGSVQAEATPARLLHLSTVSNVTVHCSRACKTFQQRLVLVPFNSWIQTACSLFQPLKLPL